MKKGIIFLTTLILSTSVFANTQKSSSKDLFDILSKYERIESGMGKSQVKINDVTCLFPNDTCEYKSDLGTIGIFTGEDAKQAYENLRLLKIEESESVNGDSISVKSIECSESDNTYSCSIYK